LKVDAKINQAFLTMQKTTPAARQRELGCTRGFIHPKVFTRCKNSGSIKTGKYPLVGILKKKLPHP
jgi:hypothetical protein